MGLISLLCLCFLPIALILWEISRRKKYNALPPGPKPISLLGNICEFIIDSRRPKHEKLAEWSKKYGDIMTIWFLTKPAIILSSFDAVRKAYIEKQNEFASRPDTLLSTLYFDRYDVDVILGRYSKRWLLKRKLMHGAIRQVTGTKNLENEAIAALEQVIAKMQRDALANGGSIDMRHCIVQNVYNLVTILVFGKRFDLDDPEFLRFSDFHTIEDEAITVSRFYDFIPPFLQQLSQLESISPTLRRMKGIIRVYRSYLRKWFAAVDYEGGEITYVTQAFKKGIDAVESKERKAEQNVEEVEETVAGVSNGIASYQAFSEQEVLAMMMNLFVASTSTTSSAVSWIFLQMILRPDIQEKCYKELLQVVGPDRPVSIADRPNLPYIEACILETLRFHSPLSLNLPHTATNDAVLGEYKIPAGTDTIVNIWAIHHDPALWKDAHNFNPDNFLDTDCHVLRPPHFMPFGAGRRVCVGEAFAKNSLFLTFTRMLQRLRFERAEGGVYSLERSEVSGEFINVPRPYIVSIHPR